MISLRSVALGFLFLQLGMAVGCSDDSAAGGGSSGDDDDCTPGASAACTCTNGSTGAQQCLNDGTFGECVCTGNPGTGGSPSGGSAGTGGAQGGSATGGTATTGGGATGGSSGGCNTDLRICTPTSAAFPDMASLKDQQSARWEVGY